MHTPPRVPTTSSLPSQRPKQGYPDVITRRQLPRFNSKRSSASASIRTLEEGDESTEIPSTRKPGALGSADALFAGGQHAMNQSLAAVVEDATGSPLPGMDVRFRDLTIRAKFTIYPPSFGSSIQVPTLLSPLKKTLQRLLSRQHTVQKDILNNVTGVFLPGRVTLVLGHAGSGKSTLMKLLSGRFPMSRQIDFSGEIWYNDMQRDHILDRIARYVAYADATDEHYDRMTVDETFKFAHACCAGQELAPWVVQALAAHSTTSDPHAMDVLTAHHRHATDVVAKKLGLDSVKQSLVSGLTPSQKKRVSIGEMAFGLKHVHIVDEISSGLDAATKFEIVDSLRSLAVHLNRTVVIAINQPTPEVLELVDDLLVLTDGHVIYQGPRSEALPHFSDLGFECPPRKDVADFLLELGTPKQKKYKNSRTDLVPLTPAEFATCFQQSAQFQATLQYLATPHSQRPATSTLSVPPREQVPKFRLHFGQDLALLLRRQLLLSARNKAFLIGRSFMVLLMGALYGTTFWQLQDTSSQLVLGLLFSCSMFLSLGQAAQLATFLGDRGVFYKQRGANFFRTGSYVLAACIAQLPFALFETLLFGSLLYWMGGYVALADRFAVFVATLFLCQVCFTAFFFLLSSAAPSAAAAQPLAVVSILLFTLFSGFLVTKNSLPGFLQWLYWLDPIAWCIRALSVNQYTAAQFTQCTYKGVDYCALYGGRTMAQVSLASFDLDDDAAWVYTTWLVFGASYLAFSFVAYLLLEFKRFETPEDTLAVSVDWKSVKKKLQRQQQRDDAGRERGTTANDEAEAMDGYVLHSQTPSDGAAISSRGGVAVVESEADDDNSDSLMLAIPREGTSGFIPVTLAFQDLWFSLPMASGEEVDILKNVSGFALPGTMTALLGDAGAGKTTLLDVISGRKSVGTIRGDLFLNGYPATDLALRRCAGYCDHADIHADAATFREAMQFAAMLRQDAAIPSIEKFVCVEECIDLLELRPLADRVVRGATREQLKRLSIGVELAAGPSLLFVDDPARGLDARAAMVIMGGLRKVADTGRTVLSTLTRPASDVFGLFDSALVLQRGGELAFFGELGPDAAQVIAYFSTLPGVVPLKPGYNPATWVLDAINPRPTTRRYSTTAETNGDLAVAFQQSDLARVLAEDLDQDGLTRPSLFLPEIKFETKRAAGAWTQLWMLLKRALRMHWRTPTYDLTRLLLSAVLAALFGVVYHGTDFTTFRGANAGVGMVFLSTIFFGLIAFNAALPVAAAERATFYREREAQTYNTLWAFTATTLAEIPFVLLSGLLFTAILFPLVGFQGHDSFVFYWLVTSLHLLMQVYMAQWFVYILPSVQGASAVGALLSSVFLLFAGFNPPTYKIPAVYKFLYYISPPSYTISALVAKVFADCEDGTQLGCQALVDAPARFTGATLKVYIEGVYSMKHDTMWRNVIVIYALTVAFRAFALLALRFVNYRKK